MTVESHLKKLAACFPVYTFVRCLYAVSQLLNRFKVQVNSKFEAILVDILWIVTGIF